MSERARETVSLRGERVAYLDLLRVVSICFVVMIHTVYQSFNSLPVEGWEWQTLNVYDSLSRWAVPIFVMISGALFLDRQKPLREILKKNVLRLVTAYLFWLAVYSVINQIYYHDFDSTLTHIIKGHYHMWFILMIIGLYLVTPLLRKIVEDKSLIRLFLILALIFAFLLPDIIKILEVYPTDVTKRITEFINSTQKNLNIYLPLGYAGYFVLGYVLSKAEISKKLEWIIYLLGIAGFVYTLVATSKRSVTNSTPYTGYYMYLSANVAAMAAAVFVFFRKHCGISGGSKAGGVVRRLSQYSFGVYLVHLIFLEYASVKLHIAPKSFNPIISVPLLCLAALLLSYAVSAALNHIKFLNKYIV